MKRHMEGVEGIGLEFSTLVSKYFKLLFRSVCVTISSVVNC